MAISQEAAKTMPATKKRRWVLRLVVGVILAGAMVVGLDCYRIIRKFIVEDQIHGTFYPLANELYAYQKEHGRPAESLNTLIPSRISAIPSSRFVDSVTYRILPDGQSWELAMHSRALHPPRTYLCRSTQTFTEEESRRILLRYHSRWVVFPD